MGEEQKITVGTVVRLKSGGPIMTVDSAIEGADLECSWPAERGPEPVEKVGGGVLTRQVAKFAPCTVEVLGAPDSEIGRREEKGRMFDRFAETGAKVVVSFAPRRGAVLPGDLSSAASASLVIDPRAPSFRRVEGGIEQEVKSANGDPAAAGFQSKIPFASVYKIEALGEGGVVFFADACPEEQVRQMFLALNQSRHSATQFADALATGIRLVRTHAQHGMLVRWSQAAAILLAPPSSEGGSKVIRL